MCLHVITLKFVFYFKTDTVGLNRIGAMIVIKNPFKKQKIGHTIRLSDGSTLFVN